MENPELVLMLTRRWAPEWQEVIWASADIDLIKSCLPAMIEKAEEQMCAEPDNPVPENRLRCLEKLFRDLHSR